MQGAIISLIVGLLITVVIWSIWVTAPICPRCGAARSKRYPHQRKDGGPDRRYSNNPLTCMECGHEGDAVSRAAYKELRQSREITQRPRPPIRSVPESRPDGSALLEGEGHNPAERSSRLGQPRNSRRWIPAGGTCDIAARHLPNGLIYLIDGIRDQTPFNPATVITGLAIGNAGQAGELGYWPNYYFLTPDQRAAYLDWLAGGRSAPDVDLGYVFLLFYGLEWRALVEGESRSEISKEIIRLYGIYGHHRSFHGYALNLLGALLLLGGRANTLDPVFKICSVHAGKHGGLPPLLLDGLVWQHVGKMLPLHWVREITNTSAAFKKGVAHERHPEQFDLIFSRLFAERFPEGLPIPGIPEPTPVPYGWALRGSPRSDLMVRTTGLVIGPSGKKRDLAIGPLWSGVQEIWQQATKQALAEQRSRRSSSATTSRPEDDGLVPMTMAPGAGFSDSRIGETLTTQATALPDSIEVWYADRADDAGIVRTTLGDLYAQRLGPSPAMLTPTQQMNLALELDHLGLAIEPDLRPDCRRSAQDEVRFVFRFDSVKRPSARCQQLRPLIEAAVVIASSDGKIDDTELEEIVGHLDQKDALSEQERRRLRLFALWLTETRQIDQGFNRLRRAELPKKHRQAIAALGIAVALRDGKITDAERKAVARLYRALDLPEADLDALLLPPTQAKAGVTIDWNAVAKLQAETHEVQGMLAQVLTQNDEPSEGQRSISDQPVPPTDETASNQPRHTTSGATAQTTALQESSLYPGLDPRAVQVLIALSGRAEISAADLKLLCAGSGLLPSAAIDLINEWSDSHLGDRVIDGDGPFQIANHLFTPKE
jgi:tellurite resistance protein